MKRDILKKAKVFLIQSDLEPVGLPDASKLLVGELRV
jgi:hypothetical protein